MGQVSWMLVVTYLSFRAGATPVITASEVYQERKQCLAVASKIQKNIKAGDGRAACLRYREYKDYLLTEVKK